MAAFAPPVQAQVAQWILGSQPGCSASVGSLTAGFGRANAEAVHLTAEGFEATLPSIEAELPLTEALWHRRVHLHSLVAKGWTLEVKEPAGAAGAAITPALASSAPAGAAQLLGAVLSRWHLPVDLSVDQVDLEGDIVGPSGNAGTPVRLHVAVTGGGLAVAHDGSFVFDASSSSTLADKSVRALSAHGELVVSLASPRVVGRLHVTSEITSTGSVLPESLKVSGDVETQSGAESYRLEVSRGGRRALALSAQGSTKDGNLRGTWTVDLTDSDFEALAGDHPLPLFSASGSGSLTSDLSLAKVHAQGSLTVKASRLGALWKPLDPVGASTFSTTFEVTRMPGLLHVDRLEVAVGADRPVASLRMIQALDVDEATGQLTLKEPRSAWADGELVDLPIAWLAGLPGGLVPTGSGLKGAFTLSSPAGGLMLRSKGRLSAAGITVSNRRGILAKDLELSLDLEAGMDRTGWTLACTQVEAAVRGTPLLALAVKASQSQDQAPAAAVDGSLFLENAFANPSTPGLRALGGSLAKGRLNVVFGPTTNVTGTVSVSGHDPRRSVEADITADIDPAGPVDFTVPLKIKVGAQTSDVTAEGTWSPGVDDNRIDVRLSGDHVDVSDLRVLAAPLAAMGGHPLTAGGAGDALHRLGPGTRDLVPFWGDWIGTVRATFADMQAGDRDLKIVAADLEIEHARLRLKQGRAALPRQNLAKLDADILFDAAAPQPYELKATGSLGEEDAVTFLNLPPSDPGAPLEGRFTVSWSLDGRGINAATLVEHAHQDFHLESTGGILRILKTSVADAVPESSSTVGDHLSSVGSAVGSIFGIKSDAYSSGRNRLPGSTEAIITFTDDIGEIGYDHIAIDAVQDADGILHISGLEMVSKDTRITGSGEIGYSAGTPLASRPLHLDTRIAVRGDLAGLLRQSGLLAPQTDPSGYAPFHKNIVFGGTLAHVDTTAWHDLLAQAAARRTDGSPSAEKAK